MKLLAAAVVAIVAGTVGCRSAEPTKEKMKTPDPPAASAADVYALTASRIDGKEEKLSTYRGKVTLIVNVASQCGFTPQYAGLERLHQTFKDRGFSVLAFPSDDFGGQEPGSEQEIAGFVARYGVTFPMFAKIHAKGDHQSPVFTAVAGSGNPPRWNFHKYLVGRDGRTIAAFKSNVTPESAELSQAIEYALETPAPGPPSR